MNDFKHKPGSAIVVKTLFLDFRVNYYTVGYFLLRFVVIRNYDVYSSAFKVFCFADGRNAAIHGNHQRWLVLFQKCVNSRQRDAIAVVDAVRNKVSDFVCRTQKPAKHGGSAEAVAIVIAVDNNTFFVGNRLFYSFGNLCHARNRKRILQIVNGGIKKFYRLFRRVYTSRYK